MEAVPIQRRIFAIHFQRDHYLTVLPRLIRRMDPIIAMNTR
jgi:hypothetical protein